MEVSTFELIFKPQSPAAPAGTAAVDTVLQGYFLTISNLENQEYTYRLTLKIHPPPDGIPNREFRSLYQKSIFIIDAGGTDNQFGVVRGSSITSSQFVTNLITVPPMGTALVAILPNNFLGNPPPVDLPLYEVRGYALLTLPALFKADFEQGFFGLVEQSDAPLKVLLTPQHRATFFSANGSISDQVQASLPVASGQALNVLNPEPGGPIIFEPIPDPDLTQQLNEALNNNPDPLLPELFGALFERARR